MHGHAPDDVHFHEVGALDAHRRRRRGLRRVRHLGLDRRLVGLAGRGRLRASVRGAHGTLPVPRPAVAELLRGVPSSPAARRPAELCTPTGAALLAALADGWGPHADDDGRARSASAPAAATPRGTPTCCGCGRRARSGSTTAGSAPPLLLETNVDDLDPRLWPAVLAALLAAGASDAWLTPILMKKGRPAHTLSVLVAADRGGRRPRRDLPPDLDDRAARDRRWASTALDREMVTVDVDGQPVAVKLARHDGGWSTRSPSTTTWRAPPRSSDDPAQGRPRRGRRRQPRYLRQDP